VISILGGTVTAAARQMSHLISFIVTFAMLVAMAAYTLYHAKSRFGSHCNKYGPTYMVVASIPLIMLELVHHVLVDHGYWNQNMYKPHCVGNMKCLNIYGIFIVIVATYLGFALMFWGSLWNANFVDKLQDIRTKWRELREVDE